MRARWMCSGKRLGPLLSLRPLDMFRRSCFMIERIERDRKTWGWQTPTRWEKRCKTRDNDRLLREKIAKQGERAIMSAPTPMAVLRAFHRDWYTALVSALFEAQDSVGRCQDLVLSRRYTPNIRVELGKTHGTLSLSRDITHHIIWGQTAPEWALTLTRRVVGSRCA